MGRLILAATMAALLALGACADLAATLPPRPTPAPTMARLPSVTPVTPSAIPPPTDTPAAITTPTPVPLLATVAVAANVRAGPSLDAAIVTGLDAGSQVRLLGRSANWYKIAAPGAVTGWMSEQVLTIDPATAAAVPASTP